MSEIEKILDDFGDMIDKSFEPKTKKKLYVAFIIDKSGSMGHLRQFVVDIFNDQLEVLKGETDEKVDTKVSIVTFSFPEEISFVRWDEDIKDIEAIQLKEYMPNGSTALFDAIGRTLQRLQLVQDGNDENTSFLVNIITDGEENASTIFTSQTIRGLIDELQETKRWTITYYGTEPDKVNRDMNMFLSNTWKFDRASVINGTYGVTLTNATKTYMDDIKAGKGYTTNFYYDPSLTDDRLTKEKKEFYQKLDKDIKDKNDAEKES